MSWVPPADDPTPGEIFAGRYVVEAPLGRGGMGAVYRVFDRALGEHVALKTLATNPDDAQALERFRREVRLARHVTHPNIARTFDFGTHQSVQFLTMELLKGPTLRKLIHERGSLDTEQALGIARQMCDGLSAAHVAGVVHQDLKPRNVVVEDDGRVVILDFGIARSLADRGSSDGAAGTPAYMAPERFSEDTPSFAVDLYAVGLILHEMLTGKLPTWNGSTADPIARLGGVEPVLALDAAPPALADLIRRLLDPEPSRRPGSAAAVARALSDIGADATRKAEPIGMDATVPFAPFPAPGPVLAVLPFDERPAETGVGVELARELTDALAQTRGLMLLASRSTEAGAARDPVKAGAELGARLVVDGTVQRRGDELKTTVRLIEVASGAQVWTEKFEAPFEEAMLVIERTARRIAEALRLELALRESRGTAPAAAMQLYLDGRRQYRALSQEAFATASRAVELAPRFQPAIALRALTAVRRVFSFSPGERDVAAQAVALALSSAPELPETQLAAAIAASSDADYVTAARLLRNAVTIAPTFGDAHEYLGQLQLEAGAPREAVKRLELAMELDVVSPLAVSLLLRHHIFTGSPQRQALEQELVRRTGSVGTTFELFQLRAALWLGDHARARAVSARITGATPGERLARSCNEILDQLGTETELDALLEVATVPRFHSLVHQVAAEAWACQGRADRAHAHIARAAEAALIDLTWLEQCPALESVRAAGLLAEATEQVRQRASAIWLG